MGTERDVVVINEGFALDDAGILIGTTYIDLRTPEQRQPIPALVKGCRPEHALEDCETILLSKPARFQAFGEALIQDDQEGHARDEFVKEQRLSVDSPRVRAASDQNEAWELLGSRIRRRVNYRETTTNRSSRVKSVTYGDEWWVFCTSIEPDLGGFDTWQATLPADRTHVSTIGQPAKFAQALARMVADQLGPQGKSGSIKQTTKGYESERVEHQSQWVVHGPVVYTDDVYEALTGQTDEMKRLASYVFTKSAEYADQREYRFAVFHGGRDEETIPLRISGMLRDALSRTQKGLVRVPPPPARTFQGDPPEPGPTKAGTKTTKRKTTSTKRQVKREETRWQLTSLDGDVLSGEGEQHEQVTEAIATHEQLFEDEDPPANDPVEEGGPSESDAAFESDQSVPADHLGASDEETAQELAAEAQELHDRRAGDAGPDLVVRSARGRAYRSFEEMLSDPAFPIGPLAGSWQESASTPEEIAMTYNAASVLHFKMPHIPEEHRQDVASAGWHTLHCIRNIYAQLGDVVQDLSIERNRFVVIRLAPSKDQGATGRIVISPSGAYAYCLQVSKEEISGHGGEEWGTLFFPMGNEVESFEELGWHRKNR